MSKTLEFESKQEKYLFLGLALVIMVVAGITLYPLLRELVEEKLMESRIQEKMAEPGAKYSKTPKEYYGMFQCSCCGQPIDADCCGMAKERKDYVDQLLLEGQDEEEITLKMVKRFGFGILMDSSQEQEVRDYMKSQSSADPPKLEIAKVRKDLGTVSQAKGVVSTVFLIRNAGKSDLVIENLDTSCMCTTARLIYQGEESPEFGMGMHGTNPKSFELKLAPGETAELKVYYDPNAHGEQKTPAEKITREVTITSNDPVEFQKKVRIELVQTP